ncbi:MAG: hypothetical protein P8X85_18255, partial [Desulfobacterales bacterium]
RYYAWIPKKTRRDGSAFMEAIAGEPEALAEQTEWADRSDLGKGEKVIPLFSKMTQLRHTQQKRADSD